MRAVTRIGTRIQAAATAYERVDIDALRRDVALANWRDYVSAWERAYDAGYEPQLATPAQLLRAWRKGSNRAPAAFGTPLVVTFSRGPDERAALLVSSDAEARIAHAPGLARRLIGAIERTAAYTPRGTLGGIALAVDAGGRVQWAYVIHAGADARYQSA